MVNTFPDLTHECLVIYFTSVTQKAHGAYLNAHILALDKCGSGSRRTTSEGMPRGQAYQEQLKKKDNFMENNIFDETGK